ncbi:MAG: acetyl-CoA carboxylase biotin carboxyl carrier protein [bacterium]
MDLNYLKKVIKIFDESALAEIRIEEDGLKIKLAKYIEKDNVSNPQFMHVSTQQATQSVPETQIIIPEIPSPEVNKENDAVVGHIIKSPIVGTFYRSASPDSEPFVDVGQHIIKGSPLCIIEAMKLMNEIESDITGTVTKILIENAQPVEYGQPIFVIKAD